MYLFLTFFAPRQQNRRVKLCFQAPKHGPPFKLGILGWVQITWWKMMYVVHDNCCIQSQWCQKENRKRLNIMYKRFHIANFYYQQGHIVVGHIDNSNCQITFTQFNIYYAVKCSWGLRSETHNHQSTSVVRMDTLVDRICYSLQPVIVTSHVLRSRLHLLLPTSQYAMNRMKTQIQNYITELPSVSLHDQHTVLIQDIRAISDQRRTSTIHGSPIFLITYYIHQYL